MAKTEKPKKAAKASKDKSTDKPAKKPVKKPVKKNGVAPGGNKQTAGAFPASINAHYIKDLSFENPNSPQAMMNTGKSPQVNVEFGVNYRKLEVEGSEDAYEVVILASIVAKYDNTTAFIIELVHGTACVLQPDVPENAIEPFLLTEIPRHAFPFVRNLIASLTGDAGYRPLMLSPVNFAQIYQARLQQKKNAQQDTPAASVAE